MRKVLKFSATWCGPCKKFAPVFEQVRAQYPQHEFVSVDVDTDPELAAQYGVQSVPTVVVLEDGQLVAHGRPGNANALVNMVEAP